ncbi:DUF1631 family protein [Acidovorax sp. FJL06]|uniref:DUF1631 family protein n=1 Tax=Acidovorax sp. FJL06 TaxID=2153365 RepID=UPI000F571BFA|nr:DUF1631 family protein [Acidovorax sp. FJL06]RQO83367.1 hypothetical protein DBV10_03275 [Acidovorax sp. FJL06]
MALKHTATSAPATPGSNTTQYQRIVQDVLTDSRRLMERIVEATRMSLQARLDQARTPGEHHAMLEARQQLVRLTSVMGERYPDALRKGLEQETVRKEEKPTHSLFTVHFDDLELMDETQISDSVERARARQVLTSAVEGPLADLDALVCAALGQPQVRPEHNPLRPEVFLQALQAVVSQMQVTEQVRHDWIGHMAQALGGELRSLYLTLIDQLKRSGVQPVGYALRQANGKYVYVAPTEDGMAPGFGFEADHAVPVTPTAPVAPAAPATQAAPPAPVPAAHADPLLTLDRLRRLLLGELGESAAPDPAPSPRETFAERFAREFESPHPLPRIEPPAPDFAMTVPAAFEALQEMNQVGQMMERLGSSAEGSLSAPPRKHAGGLAQALSTEVVALMVDNIARDSRLLWPVQQFIRALEPALMQLALTDPRFFSHKEHPARRLLQDITDRSLAFDSTEAPGFQSFMRSLMNIAGPLSSDTIEGADDFEQVLLQLHAKWAEKEQARKQERLRAIGALEHAERRHLLAAQISREIWLLPDIGKMPDAISRFLLGPWAQVMAEARLADTTSSADPGRYQELVEALIWSAQPELTRKNTGQLARLLPKLLAKLREGLASIDYPAARTEAVFELLMQLHQQAFKPGLRAAPRAPTRPAGPKAPAMPQPAPLDDDDPWVAPSEAKESGYVESSQAPESVHPEPAPAPAANDAHATPQLAIGSWVNLLVAGQWERTQLSWIGSHGNLFLFTSASGHTQSMTLRLVDRLIQQGAMQVLNQQTVVEGALDAVAQAAMRNSVDSRM